MNENIRQRRQSRNSSAEITEVTERQKGAGKETIINEKRGENAGLSKM